MSEREAACGSPHTHIDYSAANGPDLYMLACFTWTWRIIHKWDIEIEIETR